MGKLVSRHTSLKDRVSSLPATSGLYVLKFKESLEPRFSEIFGISSMVYGGPWYYVGITNNIQMRAVAHARGTYSSRLTQFAYYNGIDFDMHEYVETDEFLRELEIEYTNQYAGRP